VSLAQPGVSHPEDPAHDALGPRPLELRTKMNLLVEYPPDGSVVPEARGCGTYVAGWAGATRFDVIFVIDTSESTRDPSGADIDGDGSVGRARLDASGRFETSDPGDSILAAEIAAAREILHGLHPAHTRVGIVSFSGSPSRPLAWLFPRSPSAVTVQSLTPDHAAVGAAFDRMASQEPEGSTDMGAGIDLALAAFEGSGGVDASALERERLILFFTDGYPTLPFGPEAEAENIGAVLEAAARARDAGARIHAFAIGASALASPMAVVEMARRTGGVFTPVRHPADLVDMVRHAVPGEPRLSLRNTTTGDEAFPFSAAPDGAFHGFVRLARGRNRLEIRIASDGAPAQVATLELDLDPDAPPPALPGSLVSRRVALLEECLAALKRLTLEAERERAERLRRRLAAEIERERRRARERAEAQRKRLELVVEEEGEP
jgi:hypothetical protein